jgi:transcriptional regulator with XRE-family HTH domain
VSARRSPEIDRLLSEAERLRLEQRLSFTEIAEALGISRERLSSVLQLRRASLSAIGPAESVKGFRANLARTSNRRKHATRLAKAPMLTPEEERDAIERFMARRKERQR